MQVYFTPLTLATAPKTFFPLSGQAHFLYGFNTVLV